MQASAITRTSVLVALLAGMGLAGCDDEPTRNHDNMAPAPPAAVTSITADGEVILEWYPNGEWDLSGYKVYRSYQRAGDYGRIGTVPAGTEFYVDDDVQNGVTYWYAVSAVDSDGNESPLSRDEVFDTPRPEGRDRMIAGYYTDTHHCAYSFALEDVMDYVDPDADIAYVWTQDAGAIMIGLPGSSSITEIQDAGYHSSMDGVGWAPPDGWSPSRQVELIPGHVYVVWTRDDHYAKFRVISVTSSQVLFDWAYQVAPGNQELRAPGPAVSGPAVSGMPGATSRPDAAPSSSGGELVARPAR
jgi:hypothetical protein